MASAKPSRSRLTWPCLPNAYRPSWRKSARTPRRSKEKGKGKKDHWRLPYVFPAPFLFLLFPFSFYLKRPCWRPGAWAFQVAWPLFHGKRQKEKGKRKQT